MLEHKGLCNAGGKEDGQELDRWHRCQPSRNRAGNPAFLSISRIPAFFREHPAFLASF